jgi:Secretion system C-terminal sorting domain
MFSPKTNKNPTIMNPFSYVLRSMGRLAVALLLLFAVGSSLQAQNCEARAGRLGNPKVCVTGNTASIQAEAIDPARVPSGFTTLYVLTKGPRLVIQNTSRFPFFRVTPDSLYTIHTLVYNPSTLDLSIVRPGVTTGGQVNSLLVQGGGRICAALDVTGSQFTFGACAEPCFASAGTLRATEGACLDAGRATLRATVNAAPVLPDTAFRTLYVLTRSDSLVIVQVGATPSFTVTRAARYRIHTLVYNPRTLDLGIVQLGRTTGVQVNSLLVQGGGSICAALDVAGARFDVAQCPCAATAGALRAVSNNCIEGAGAKLEAAIARPATRPTGFQTLYVLTRSDSLVIVQTAATPSFTVNRPGTYTIHTLVYNPATLDLSIVVPGRTTGFQVNSLLVQGGGSICAALDVPGAKFTVRNCPCKASAGTLRPNSDACIEGGTAALRAMVTSRPVLPDTSFRTLYVLTRSDSLVIVQVGATPSFTVTRAARYRIHTLVYNPRTLDLGIVQLGRTTGVQVNALLEQGGGSICGALDVAGARFDVASTCPCVATFGFLRPVTDGCLEAGTARLEARQLAQPNRPAGYQTIYVLTRGDSLVIEQTAASPAFNVTRAGRYTIHTLVYNPATLDLSIVRPGVTTGVQVNGLLKQGGGQICAALDVAGAKFTVAACACRATAGTLRPVSDACLTAGKAVLKAAPSGNLNIPSGYRLLYVLTRGDSLVIEQTNEKPEFTVNRATRYTIHTLVYNPATLNLGIVVPGRTTGVQVNGLLIQGGGTICAALDVAGARFNVSATNCCTADAGKLRLEGRPCLYNGAAIVSAKVNERPVVPTGFQVLYVLTSGDKLVIEAVSLFPHFLIRRAGKFTIHTLVYNPRTLDLSTVTIGRTTGVDVNNLLIQGGGAICGSLDVGGAPFELRACNAHVAPVEGSSLLFPNPTSNDLRVQLNRSLIDRATTIDIMDMSGKPVQRLQFEAGTSMGDIDVSKLANGMYFLRISSEDQPMELLKFSKQ